MNPGYERIIISLTWTAEESLGFVEVTGRPLAITNISRWTQCLPYERRGLLDVEIGEYSHPVVNF